MYFFNKPSKEQNLWKWLASRLSEFESASPEDSIYAQFHEKLMQIHPSLVFEYQPNNVTGTSILTLSSNGDRNGIPFVEELVSSAPKIEGLRVVAFRQPINESLTIEMNNTKLSTDDIQFCYETAPDNMIDIELYVGKISPAEEDQYLAASRVLLDAVVGEYNVMTKIRDIQLITNLDNEKEYLPLRKIVEIF
jgi:hypothetical protein